MNKKQDVDELMTDFAMINPDLGSVIVDLKKYVLSMSSELEEEVKYGGVVFLLNGKLIAGMFLYKDYMSFEFSRGCDLEDKYNVLEGKGKLRRHVKIRKKSDVKTKYLKQFIVQALGGVSI